MTETKILPTVSFRRLRSLLKGIATKIQRKPRQQFSRGCAIAAVVLCGCSGFQTKATYKEAHDLFDQRNYSASLNKYEQIVEKYPPKADRALFEMGIIYSHPQNQQRNFEKSVECFERLLKDYPESAYRQDAQTMVFYINNVPIKDQAIAAEKAALEALKQEIESKENEIAGLQRQIGDLEKKVFVLAIKSGSIDKILIEKQDRRLTLLSNGETLKTYKIALGGDPIGPKERQGDNKTPEGTYVIDSRNTGSLYHLSLHISYPNERDRKRAKELGVSPGGNIMIHGIKNGFSWIGDAHTEADWTKGCIAVTDEEIEEISRAVPNGTTVEIRP